MPADWNGLKPHAPPLRSPSTDRLGQGCGEVVADPSEILLGQSDLTSEQAGLPLV